MCARTLGERSRQRILAGGGGERSVLGESCPRSCTHGDPRPTQETAGVNATANLASTPSG